MNNKLHWNGRQKIVITLTILTFAVLIWQIYLLVRSDVVSINSTSNVPTASPMSPAITTDNLPSTATQTNGTSTESENNLNIVKTAETKLLNGNNTNAPAQLTTSNTDAPQLVNQLPTGSIKRRSNLALDQQQYMKTANQYELAKMQRRLMEEQVAIATARRSIADTEQQTQKILGGQADISTDGVTELPIRLTYLGQQGNQWRATIIRNGIYHDVVDGSTLIDGTKIIYINQDGVELKEHGKLLLLSFDGTKTIANPADSNDHDVRPNPYQEPAQTIPNNNVNSQTLTTNTPAVPFDALPLIQNSTPANTNTSPVAIVGNSVVKSTPIAAAPQN